MNEKLSSLIKSLETEIENKCIRLKFKRKEIFLRKINNISLGLLVMTPFVLIFKNFSLFFAAFSSGAIVFAISLILYKYLKWKLSR